MAHEKQPDADLAGITFHLTPESVWRKPRSQGEYRPELFEDEGFIHCTNGEMEVLDVANRYYRGDPRSFLLLDVDLALVTAPAIYDDPDRRYPHIYGPIERSAVRRVRRVERAADGTFTGIGEEDPVPVR